MNIYNAQIYPRLLAKSSAAQRACSFLMQNYTEQRECEHVWLEPFVCSSSRKICRQTPMSTYKHVAVFYFALAVICTFCSSSRPRARCVVVVVVYLLNKPSACVWNK